MSADDPASGGTRPPIRILVKGASRALVVHPPPARYGDVNYPRGLEVRLARAGVASVVRNGAAEGQLVRRAICDWHEDVQLFNPDVIVLQYGGYECTPRLVPHFFDRHVHTRHTHPGRVRWTYRHRVLLPVWQQVGRLQRWADGVSSPLSYRMTPARTCAELETYIRRTREVCRPLIFVLGCGPTAGKWQYMLPGMAERLPVMNKALAALVARLDIDDVRFIDVASLVRDPEVDLGDGSHFSADFHEVLARELSEAVVTWASVHPWWS